MPLSVWRAALQTEELDVRRRSEHRHDAHKEEQKNRTLKLLALGPDHIGADRLIQKVGIQSAANEDTWAVAVRGEHSTAVCALNHAVALSAPLLGHTAASPLDTHTVSSPTTHTAASALTPGTPLSAVLTGLHRARESQDYCQHGVPHVTRRRLNRY